MKALVYHGPGAAERGRTCPTRQSRRRRTPSCRSTRRRSAGPTSTSSRETCRRSQPGTILGHEAVGTVVEIGSAVTTARAGRPRARLLHHVVRPVPVLQGRPLRALHRRRRLDLRPPDRRAAGRARPRSVRRHLGLQGAGRALGRAGPVPRRHPPDRVRGRRPQRSASSRATRSRSSAPARSGSRRS